MNDEREVLYYQERGDDSTLLKSVVGGEDEGLYLWQIGLQAWKKLDGEAYRTFNELLFQPANHRVLNEEQVKKEIKKLGKGDR